MSGHVANRVAAKGPKRILALDGGGVRGLVTLGVLERVEEILAARSPDPAAFRLSHYFDLCGGTSTGAIIATLVAFGWRVSEIVDLYYRLCPRVFSSRPLLSYLYLSSKFDTSAFTREIESVMAQIARAADIAPDALTLGTPHLQTGLAIVCKRIDTGSVWVQTNAPGRRYWTPDDDYWWPGGGQFFANRDYPLKSIVQASASAPFYLDDVQVTIGPDEWGTFVDGGASPHNCPAKELFLMAAMRDYDQGGRSPTGLGWQAGADKIFMLSVGTGSHKKTRASMEQKLGFLGTLSAKKALYALESIIEDAMNDSITWMQALSEPTKPVRINGKWETMNGLRIARDPLLSFQRVNPRIEIDWLRDEIGVAVTPGELKRTRQFDWAARRNLERLHLIGRRTGDKMIDAGDFPATFDVTEPRDATAAE